MAWKLINARAETVVTASAFRKAFEQRRCLVPVDGFFEWKKVGKQKQPYMIAIADSEPFTLAGCGITGRTLRAANGSAAQRAAEAVSG
jgi:putative SOS response-associated peptidase YedK